MHVVDNSTRSSPEVEMLKRITGLVMASDPSEIYAMDIFTGYVEVYLRDGTGLCIRVDQWANPDETWWEAIGEEEPEDLHDA